LPGDIAAKCFKGTAGGICVSIDVPPLRR
jgi:hypothetical protein